MPDDAPQPQPAAAAAVPAAAAHPTAASLGLPPWAVGILSIVGVAVGGGGAGFFGGSQAAKDIAKLEEKVDKLDGKLTELRIAIASHAAGHGNGTNGGSP